MKPQWIAAGVGLLAVPAIALAFQNGTSKSAPPAKSADKPAALKTTADKVSYSIGLDLGRNLKREALDVNLDVLTRGIRDALAGVKPLMTDEEIEQVMTAFQKEQTKAVADKNKKDGDAYLAANKKKDGVKSTASGLQYKVIKAGKGKAPKPTDTVVVHYRGTLIDGTEFDSSHSRGEPATFAVGEVIKGWTEALQLMTPGAKFEVTVPAALGYGERGAGPDIGPNAVLIFEVELLEIKS